MRPVLDRGGEGLKLYPKDGSGVKIKYRPKSIAGGYVFERPIIGKITKKHGIVYLKRKFV